MEYQNKRNKVHVTRVTSGMRLVDDRYPDPVCTSKNRCILGFLAGGEQVLLNENELVRDFENGDGTKIRPHTIVPGKVNTVYSRCGEFVLARAT